MSAVNTLNAFFDWLLNSSLRASFLTLAVFGLQLTLGRWLPARWRYADWDKDAVVDHVMSAKKTIASGQTILLLGQNFVDHSSRHLLVFVTARVLDPAAQSAPAQLPTIISQPSTNAPPAK